MSLPVLHLLPLGVLLLASAITDVARRRIPNPITVSVLVLGLGAQLMAGGWRGGLGALAAVVLTFAVLYRAWLASGIGGGDVKLAAAVAVWVGLDKLVVYALATAFVGGIVAAVCFAVSKRRAREEIKGNLMATALIHSWPAGVSAGAGRVSVPYGIAIAAGASVALLGPWSL